MSEALPALPPADLGEVEARLARMRAALPPTNEPLRHAARRLRWFRAAFLSHVALVERETGQRFAVNDTALAAVFVDWLRSLAVQRPSDRAEREAFLAFSAGLALREFCRQMPLQGLSPKSGAEATRPEEFWPEGYVLTTFCLTLLGAAQCQDFGAPPRIDPLFLDLRSWWSFRENARRDPSFAAGFLQALSGQDPNWRLPDVFWAREPAQ